MWWQVTNRWLDTSCMRGMWAYASRTHVIAWNIMCACKMAGDWLMSCSWLHALHVTVCVCAPCQWGSLSIAALTIDLGQGTRQGPPYPQSLRSSAWGGRNGIEGRSPAKEWVGGWGGIRQVARDHWIHAFADRRSNGDSLTWNWKQANSKGRRELRNHVAGIGTWMMMSDARLTRIS